MKAGTLNHVKTKRLKRKLGIPLYQAAGLLESLWQLAAECADDGAIGKYSDEEIASHLEWERDPEELIKALLDCRWLDSDEVSRLVVHDWFDHAPNYIKDRIRKREQREITTYDDKTRDKQRNVRGLSETPRDKSTPVAINPPNQSQPIQSQPIPPCAADAAATEEVSAEAVPRDEFDSELHDWLIWWNGLKAGGLVPHGCDPDEPSQGVIAGWKRVKSKPKLRGLLQDRDAIEREIRASDYCRESWFRLEKLFGATNRAGALVIENLLDGAYRNAKPKGVSNGRIGPGQRYQGD